MVRLQVNIQASPAPESGISGEMPNRCTHTDRTPCAHGIFAVGISCALRFRCSCCTPWMYSACSSCIFGSAFRAWCIHAQRSAQDLAAANFDCTDAGAAVINLSLTLAQASMRAETELDSALGDAFRRGTPSIAAAGNQSMFAASAIT